ncbi:MAG: long-chain-acyl-CoA synthetase [Robiginitomaculum sp.]|nr:MAG: long-chain-acyl-CoA synthetase [Robiginitomaculum sp.]
MGIIKKIIQEVKFVRTMKRMLSAVEDVDSASTNLLPDDIERIVDKYPSNIAFIEDEREWTYREFDDYANRVAHWALGEGGKPGDTVAIFVRNRLEYVAVWFGLSKIGMIPALINYQLRAAALAHCVKISHAKLVIVDHELVDAWDSAKDKLPDGLLPFGAFGKTKSLNSFDEAVATQNSTRPVRDIRSAIVAGDVFMKLFTSGTTGMPKAAKITHTRGQYYMRGFVVASGATSADRILMVLPMYHGTGGLCGVGLALATGGAVIVRPKFSASSFWDEAVQYKATMFMYVGELCRFLLNAPDHPKERAHQLRCIVGNGLRPEVWSKFTERFNIPKVVEFYGATEGNISMINFTNKVGAVGRTPEYMRKKSNGDLVKFDIETNTHIRGEDGFCQRTEVGEIGELIGEIRPGETRYKYEGYEDKKASAKKIITDVYTKGDRWFHTGDLLWRDAEGYYYFADRIGDTFRWKAENVATNEVAAAITERKGVTQANVYGVAIPGYDGKAGMASLVADQDLDMAALHKHIEDALPPYARPVFLRISSESETTGTFKYKKTDLVKDGFDPSKIKDAVYMADPSTKQYIRIDAGIFKKISQEKIRF